MPSARRATAEPGSARREPSRTGTRANVARWRSGFLASLMSSRRGFESHPRYLRADAEHWRAQRAVTASPQAVVVRLHPSAPPYRRLRRGGTVATNQTIWASLDDIRIGERTVSRLSASTVERYREWLEQGPRHRRFDSRATETRSSCVTAATAWQPLCGRTHRDRGGGAPIGRIRLLITAWIHRGRAAACRAARPHPWGRALGSASRLHRAGRGFDSHVSTSCLRSVKRQARALYGRGAGSTPAGGSLASLAGRLLPAGEAGLRRRRDAADGTRLSGPVPLLLCPPAWHRQRRPRFARARRTPRSSGDPSTALRRQRTLVRVQPGVLTRT